jgi:hypothetical protein
MMKEYASMELVRSVAQLADNIRRYNEEAAKFAELMPYNHSWYALRTDAGWLLGPSKYIGYQAAVFRGLTPAQKSEFLKQKYLRVMTGNF